MGIMAIRWTRKSCPPSQHWPVSKKFLTVILKWKEQFTKTWAFSTSQWQWRTTRRYFQVSSGLLITVTWENTRTKTFHHRFLSYMPLKTESFPISTTDLSQLIVHPFIHLVFLLEGKEIGKLDSVKVAKSLKHYLAALSLKPTSKSIHIQIGRLYHDSCRFREGQPFLENACAKWPKDPIFRHNLSILLEKAVMSEMRVDQYISVRKKE